MRATRRRILQLSLLGAVVGCTPDPTVGGTPGTAAEPAVPTRTAEAEAVAVWVERHAVLVDALAAAPDSWGADELHAIWIAALQGQTATHASRVTAENPVVGGPTAFPVPSPTTTPPPPATTPAEAVAALTASVADGVPAALAALLAADTASGRLFYASLATASTAGLSPGLPPIEGGAAPAPFADPDIDASVAVALSHAWALLRGLELGLGRLPSSDALHPAGVERFDSARVLRNRLLAVLTGDVPDVQVWDLPNAMSTAVEIRAAWAVLENNLLNAVAGLTAADDSVGAGWLQDMLGQVGWVHRWGGRLSHWPGWVASA